MTDGGKANNMNIRVNDSILNKLDNLVKSCGYKSRSDCIKSLIEERYAKETANDDLKKIVIEIIKNNSEIRDYIVSLASNARM